MSLTVLTYIRFLAVGGLVGVVTVLVQAGLGVLLPQSPTGYVLSMIAAYVLGTVAAFFLHGALTFAHSGTHHRSGFRPFTYFAAGSAVAAVLISALASWIRYGLTLDAWLPKWAGTVAFGISALLVAIFSFLFSRTVVFKQDAASRS